MSDAMQGVLPAPAILATDIDNANASPIDELDVLSDATAVPTALPEHVSETLYIQNLNERIKVDGQSLYLCAKENSDFSFLFFLSVMKQSLRALFKNYGEVLDVVAHGNLRMRGQAFVSFASTDSAKKAQKEVNRFPLYSKPMVRSFSDKPRNCWLMARFQQISFARSRSDAVVKKLDNDNYDQHKSARLDHKSTLGSSFNSVMTHGANCRENKIYESSETQVQVEAYGCGK